MTREQDDHYRDLIDSDRVSGRTRALLLARGAPDDPAYRPAALTPANFTTLRAVLERVLPQSGEFRIDLAARLDAQLSRGEGDGWRHAALPRDPAAYQCGLQTLDAQARAEFGRPFADLAGEHQDTLLARAADGTLAAPSRPGTLGPQPMRMWFEDVRATAVRAFVSHPMTMARMGYSGIGYGGDGEPKSGFTRIGIGEAEPWEPARAAPVP